MKAILGQPSPAFVGWSSVARRCSRSFAAVPDVRMVKFGPYVAATIDSQHSGFWRKHAVCEMSFGDPRSGQKAARQRGACSGQGEGARAGSRILPSLCTVSWVWASRQVSAHRGRPSRSGVSPSRDCTVRLKTTAAADGASYSRRTPTATEVTYNDLHLPSAKTSLNVAAMF